MASSLRSASILDELVTHYGFYKGTAHCQISELAHVLGVKRPTVYSWLRHKGQPKEDKIELINQWLQEKKKELQVREG
jgi:predicted DNA-binding transcriptional regulator AlpA